MALGVSTTFETFPETCQYFYNESFHDVPAGHFPTEIRSSQHFAALTNRVGCRSPSKHVNLTPTYGTQRSSGFPPCSPNPLSGSCASLEGGSPPCQTRGWARKGIWCFVGLFLPRKAVRQWWLRFYLLLISQEGGVAKRAAGAEPCYCDHRMIKTIDSLRGPAMHARGV